VARFGLGESAFFNARFIIPETGAVSSRRSAFISRVKSLPLFKVRRANSRLSRKINRSAVDKLNGITF